MQMLVILWNDIRRTGSNGYPWWGAKGRRLWPKDTSLGVCNVLTSYHENVLCIIHGIKVNQMPQRPTFPNQTQGVSAGRNPGRVRETQKRGRPLIRAWGIKGTHTEVRWKKKPERLDRWLTPQPPPPRAVFPTDSQEHFGERTRPSSLKG